MEKIIKTAKSYFPPNCFIFVLLILSSICDCKLVLYTDTCILVINFIYLTSGQSLHMHLWHLNKSKFNLKSVRVNLVAPAPVECMLYLPSVRAMQYKLGPKRLTRLGNLNVLKLTVTVILPGYICCIKRAGSTLGRLYTG